jgi:hypothetical protein
MQKRAKEASVKNNMHTIQLAIEDFSTLSEGYYPVDLAQDVAAASGVGANATSVAGEEPLVGVPGADALVPVAIKNPIVAGNNTAQTEHPYAVWDSDHAGSASVDFIDNVDGAAAGSPSNTLRYLINGYGVDAVLALQLSSGQ